MLKLKRLLICMLIVSLSLIQPLQSMAAPAPSLVLKRLQKSKKKLKKLEKTYSKKVLARLTQTLQKQNMAELKTKIQDYLESQELPANDWSIYVKHLDSNISFTINNRSFASASTIKLYAMAATYDKIKRKKLSSSAALTNMLHGMITYSSNDYFNAIVAEHVTPEYLQTYIKRQGFTKTNYYRGIGPSSHPYYEESSTVPGINSTSAADCGKLLEKIYRGKLVSKEASNQMLNLLKQQTFRYKIPAGIPSGITVANKTGEFENLMHDAAIVYGKNTDYIICIFSENTVIPETEATDISESDTETEETEEMKPPTPSGYTNVPYIQQISRMVYNHLNP